MVGQESHAQPFTPNLWQSVVDRLPLAIWLLDSTGMAVYTNQTAAALGCPGLACLVLEGLGLSDWSEVRVPASASVKIGPAVFDVSLQEVTAGDSTLVVALATPAEGSAKGPDIPSGVDVSQLESDLVIKAIQYQQMYLREERLANTDGLTGCLNRRALQNVLDGAVGEALANGSHLSFAILDIDHFKSLNDRHGHQAGDEALRNLGALLRKSIRGIDSVGRMGGEEFGIVLPHADVLTAMSVAERIRQSIQSARLCVRPVTASFGVATLDGVLNSGEQLYSAADDALYFSKNAGRNRVTHAASLDAPSEAA